MSLEHDCSSCRHNCVDFFEPPCCECYSHPDKDPDKWEPQFTRHYDRIINKTPEELAEFINDLFYGLHDNPGMCDICDRDSVQNCKQCWLDWLRQEAEA